MKCTSFWSRKGGGGEGESEEVRKEGSETRVKRMMTNFIVDPPVKRCNKQLASMITTKRILQLILKIFLFGRRLQSFWNSKKKHVTSFPFTSLSYIIQFSVFWHDFYKSSHWTQIHFNSITFDPHSTSLVKNSHGERARIHLNIPPLKNLYAGRGSRQIRADSFVINPHSWTGFLIRWMM